MRKANKERWSVSAAQQWRMEHGWQCGFNYLPRTAVNWNEMWQGATFDIKTIEQELIWAHEVGFNTLRTNLPFIVWQHERDALMANIRTFLGACESANIKVILTLLDDCEFSGESPRYGTQPEPVSGVHNSQALASPGRAEVMNRDLWPEIERYAKDVISEFGSDSRIILWDLYNEPTNRMLFKNGVHSEFDIAIETHSHALMENLFVWAREMNPIQPLTVAAWHAEGETPFAHTTDQRAFELSDVITFHAYVEPGQMTKVVQALPSRERPVLCTEWMARHLGSTYPSLLPMLKQEDIGAIQWGLVKGKTQTWIPWPWVEVPENQRDLWFHDLLDENGKPFDIDELALITQCLQPDGEPE